MKQAVMLSILGRQSYMDQEPETLELVTEGVLEDKQDHWLLSYEESDLTGMAGVTTTFAVYGDKVILSRTGKLNSRMVFQPGVTHESLYQMEFGALLISVCAQRIMADICHDGGMIDLVYTIELEQSASGTIDYHLDIRPKA